MKQIISIVAQMGPLLQGFRKSAHLSQADLAQRLGISQPRVSAMELNPGSINLDQLLSLCSVLNLEITVQAKAHAREDHGATKLDW